MRGRIVNGTYCHVDHFSFRWTLDHVSRSFYLCQEISPCIIRFPQAQDSRHFTMRFARQICTLRPLTVEFPWSRKIVAEPFGTWRISPRTYCMTRKARRKIYHDRRIWAVPSSYISAIICSGVSQYWKDLRKVQKIPRFTDAVALVLRALSGNNCIPARQQL